LYATAFKDREPKKVRLADFRCELKSAIFHSKVSRTMVAQHGDRISTGVNKLRLQMLRSRPSVILPNRRHTGNRVVRNHPV